MIPVASVYVFVVASEEDSWTLTVSVVVSTLLFGIINLWSVSEELAVYLKFKSVPSFSVTLLN